MAERKAKRKPPTISQQAAAMAAAILNPQIELENRRAADRSRDVQGFSLAAAEMLKGVGPTVAGIYGDASQRQDAYSRGLGIGQQMATQSSTDQANQLLAQNNAPTRQTAGPEAANVVYGLGALPASTLNREGAAFGAAASMLPASAVGRGQQDVTASYRSADDRISQLEAQRAGLYQQGVSSLEDRSFRERQLASDTDYRNRQLAEDARQANQNAQIQWESVEGTLRAYGLDEEKLAQAKAEFMTNQTGQIYTVKHDKKGNITVVSTGQLAPGSQAAGNLADVAADTTTTAKDRAKARKEAIANRGDALATASGAIRESSADWAGKPIENPKPSSLLNPGKYLDKNGKGTNDPAKAAREGGLKWSEMVNQAMQMEEVQQLMTRYGLSRSKARAKVVAWLRSFGFKPPAAKPKPPPLSQGARNSPH